MRRLGIAFVGEVDHGKSTLIGRLLLETGSLSPAREREVREGRLPLAHIIDQLGRERDEGLTVTSAEALLRAGERRLVLVDAPGHEEFLRHMLSGASVAGAAVIVVDAEEGVRPETRRHALLVRLLRIPQAIAVVNKIDRAGEAAFRDVRGRFEELAREIELPLRDVVPASAARGLNVTAAGPGVPWHDGPTVLDAMLGFRSPEGADGPVRFSVQGLYDFTGRPVTVGRVERGTLRAGAELVALPGGELVRIREIIDFPERDVESLEAGRAGSLIVDRPAALRRGMVLAPPDALPPAGEAVRGRAFCLGPSPIARDARYLFRCATQEVGVRVESVEERVDSGSLASLGAGREAGPLELAAIGLRCDETLVVEDPNESPALGRFVLEDARGPVALGMVLEIAGDEARAGGARP